MKKVIRFDSQNMQGLHFFVENLNFPVVAASYNEWEKQQLNYLENNVKSGGFSSEADCKWCINRNIPYQILYPIKKSSIFKNPYKYYEFLLLKYRLKKYSL